MCERKTRLEFITISSSSSCFIGSTMTSRYHQASNKRKWLTFDGRKRRQKERSAINGKEFQKEQLSCKQFQKTSFPHLLFDRMIKSSRRSCKLSVVKFRTVKHWRKTFTQAKASITSKTLINFRNTSETIRKNNAQESRRQEKNTPVYFYSSREKHRKSSRSREKRDSNAKTEQKNSFCASPKVHKQMCNLSHFRGMVI